jgi:hypothetical protein
VKVTCWYYSSLVKRQIHLKLEKQNTPSLSENFSKIVSYFCYEGGFEAKHKKIYVRTEMVFITNNKGKGRGVEKFKLGEGWGSIRSPMQGQLNRDSTDTNEYQFSLFLTAHLVP